MSGKLDGMDGRFESLDGRIDGVGERIARLPATLEIAELHRLLNEVAQRPAAEYGDRFDALEKHLAGPSTR